MRTPQTPEIANGQANFFQDNQSVPFSRNYSSHQSGPTRPHNLVNPTRYNYLTQNDLLRGPQQTHTVVTNPQALPTTTLTVSPLTSPVDPNFNISAESGFISTRSKSPGTSMVNSRLHQSDISGNNNGKSNESVTPCDPVTIQPTQSRLARRFFSSSSQKGSRTDASEASENKNDLNFSTNHNSNKTEITTTATIETQSESNRQRY